VSFISELQPRNVTRAGVLNIGVADDGFAAQAKELSFIESFARPSS
jgi:hypothetical protein